LLELVSRLEANGGKTVAREVRQSPHVESIDLTGSPEVEIDATGRKMQSIAQVLASVQPAGSRP